MGTNQLYVFLVNTNVTVRSLKLILVLVSLFSISLESLLVYFHYFHYQSQKLFFFCSLLEYTSNINYVSLYQLIVCFLLTLCACVFDAPEMSNKRCTCYCNESNFPYCENGQITRCAVIIVCVLLSSAEAP